MTDNEIRLKIAELKGFEHIRTLAGDRIWVVQYQDESLPSMKAYREVECANWPTDIAAAWELVEEMPYFRLFRLFRLSPQGFQCQSADCGCWGDHVIDGENKDGTPYHCGCIYADADTAARAICLAYLQFIESRGKI